jgi:hypothetical protein
MNEKNLKGATLAKSGEKTKKSKCIPASYFKAAKLALIKEAGEIGCSVRIRRSKISWGQVRDGFPISSVSGTFFPVKNKIIMNVRGRPGHGEILYVLAHELAHARQRKDGVLCPTLSRYGRVGKASESEIGLRLFRRNDQLRRVLHEIWIELSADKVAEECMNNLGIGEAFKRRLYRFDEMFYVRMVEDVAFEKNATETERAEAATICKIVDELYRKMHEKSLELDGYKYSLSFLESMFRELAEEILEAEKISVKG